MTAPKNTAIKVLVTAKNGQLGWELNHSLTSNSIETIFLDSKELDITDADAVQTIITDFKPDFVINAAAYTAVDKAESDSEAAYRVNQQGAKNLALGCKEVGARLIHVSTDFVFDATKNTPYIPDDATNPLGVYGASKLAGEQAVLDVLGNNASIIRTAWVYSTHGNNFVKTMLRLMAERDKLGVVADQVGTPTNAKNLAKAIWQLVLQSKENSAGKIYHWTDLGTASWYDFAVAIQELGVENGLLAQPISIAPIKASQYPTPAERPVYSVLDTSALREELSINGVHWREALKEMMEDLVRDAYRNIAINQRSSNKAEAPIKM